MKRLSNKIKWLLISLVVIVALIISKDYIQNLVLGDYQYVIKGDKDNIYDRLLLVENTSSKDDFNQIMDTLLSKNNPDLLSMEAAIRYVRENQLAVYKQQLITIETHFKAIPKDSVWRFEYSEDKYRTNYLENAHIVPYLEETIQKLE